MTILEQLPVLGFSGGRADETMVLLGRLRPVLTGQGLKVALARAGSGEPELLALVRSHDLVLVAGETPAPVSRVLLLGPGETPPGEVTSFSLAVPGDCDREALILAFLERWLPGRWRQAPVSACVLIGGQSRRMGRPKHLIRQEGRTWLERTVTLLQGVVEEVVVAGAGELPELDLLRLADPPGVAGPLAGLAAAMRWRPWRSWLLVACDLPELQLPALSWLLTGRRPGVWAVIPRLGNDYVEPLLAYYDFRMGEAVEELVARGEPRIGRLAESERVAIATPPAELWPSWRNVNYPQEIEV